MGPRSDERGNIQHQRDCLRMHKYASMGPRSDERGNFAAGNQWLGRTLASMGPRSDERGNASWHAAKAVTEMASMGPRSDERGNAPLPELLHAAGGLQWGRARMSAEILPSRGVCSVYI